MNATKSETIARLRALSAAERARILGCTVAQLATQYQTNAAECRRMAEQAERAGRPIRGFTAAQWQEMAERSQRHASECSAMPQSAS